MARPLQLHIAPSEVYPPSRKVYKLAVLLNLLYRCIDGYQKIFFFFSLGFALTFLPVVVRKFILSFRRKKLPVLYSEYLLLF